MIERKGRVIKETCKNRLNSTQNYFFFHLKKFLYENCLQIKKKHTWCAIPNTVRIFI